MISERCIANIFSDWYWKSAGVNSCFFIFYSDYSQWFIYPDWEDLPNNSALIQPYIFRKSLIHDHALRRLRPFALLRLMILRPPGVDILARKPCFFFLRRLFGWKVRFIGFLKRNKVLIINKTHHLNSLQPRFQALMIFQIAILILLNFFDFDVNTPEAEITH